MTAMAITELEKDIERKQRALARAKREARLTSHEISRLKRTHREKANAEALEEFRRTGQVPHGVRQEIEQTFGVKAAFKPRWGGEQLPALTFLKGAYEYAVITQIVGAGLHFELIKQNRDPRIWHDRKSGSVSDVADVVSSLRRFMRHVAETEEEKLSRLYPLKDDPKRKACEQLRRMKVLPVGAYPIFDMHHVGYYANLEEIRLSLAKGKVRWGGWIKKEEGEEITFVDVTDKDAAKIIRSFFRSKRNGKNGK